MGKIRFRYKSASEYLEVMEHILGNIIKLQDMNLDNDELGKEWKESQIEWWTEKYKELQEECKAYCEFSKQMLERMESGQNEM